MDMGPCGSSEWSLVYPLLRNPGFACHITFCQGGLRELAQKPSFEVAFYFLGECIGGSLGVLVIAPIGCVQFRGLYIVIISGV